MSLLPWLASRNENNFVKTEATGHLTSGDQVTVVDWIEGATHHAKPIALLRVEAALPGQACGAR
jgi:hypothetical protein